MASRALVLDSARVGIGLSELILVTSSGRRRAPIEKSVDLAELCLQGGEHGVTIHVVRKVDGDLLPTVLVEQPRRLCRREWMKSLLK